LALLLVSVIRANELTITSIFESTGCDILVGQPFKGHPAYTGCVGIPNYNPIGGQYGLKIPEQYFERYVDTHNVGSCGRQYPIGVLYLASNQAHCKLELTRDKRTLRCGEFTIAVPNHITRMSVFDKANSVFKIEIDDYLPRCSPSNVTMLKFDNKASAIVNETHTGKSCKVDLATDVSTTPSLVFMKDDSAVCDRLKPSKTTDRTTIKCGNMWIYKKNYDMHFTRCGSFWHYSTCVWPNGDHYWRYELMKCLGSASQ